MYGCTSFDSCGGEDGWQTIQGDEVDRAAHQSCGAPARRTPWLLGEEAGFFSELVLSFSLSCRAFLQVCVMYMLGPVMLDPTFNVLPCGCTAPLICGEPPGLFTGPLGARVIRGEYADPLLGEVGADSDCLLARISSANHTRLFAPGGVPGKEKKELLMYHLQKKTVNLNQKDAHF